MDTATAIVTAATWWVYLGLAVAAVFLLFGLDRVEPNARGAFVFRTLLIPGLVLLWPLVLWRWRLMAQENENHFKRHHPPRAAHGRVWSVLAALIPAIFLVAMIVDLPPRGDLAPVRLSEPAQ